VLLGWVNEVAYRRRSRQLTSESDQLSLACCGFWIF
jgi:hypothetical protein